MKKIIEHENIKIEDYYETLYFRAFAYNNEYLNAVTSGILDDAILNENFIKKLYDIINEWCILNILSSDCKNNLYIIISYLRKKLPNFWMLYNEMIGALNCTSTENEFVFLEKEFCRRTLASSISNDYITFKENIGTVKKSIGNEFIFLEYLYNSDEEEFLHNLSELTMDIYFYMSLCSFIYNIPDIFDDEIFLKRVRTIIKIDKEKLKYKEYIKQMQVSEKELRFIKSSNKYFKKLY